MCTAYYNEVTINNARQTTPQHDLWPAWLLKAAAKPGATKNKRLPAPGKKKLLLAEVHKEDQDILAKALEALWKLQHFNEYPIRIDVQNGSVGLFD